MLFGLLKSKSDKPKAAQDEMQVISPEAAEVIKSLTAISEIMSSGIFGMLGTGIIECCGYLITLLKNGAIDVGNAKKILDGIKGMLVSIIAFLPKTMSMDDAVRYRAAVSQLMLDIGLYATSLVLDHAETSRQIHSAIGRARAEMLQQHWDALPFLTAEVRAASRAAEMQRACTRRPADPHAAIAPDLAEVPQVDHLAEGQTPDQVPDRAGGRAGAGGKPPKYGW